MFFSIAIPTYEMCGKGVYYLQDTFNRLNNQTFKDFEIVISDHSKDSNIEKLCDNWKSYLDIKYFKNDYKIGSSSANINNAINNSKGDWIKILFQDDYLLLNNSLEILKNKIHETNCLWIVNACNHTSDDINYHTTHIPRWNEQVYIGNNTIGAPSLITIKNINDKILFDENLLWLMDCDYYKQYYDKYKEPLIIEEVLVTIRQWDEQVSNILTEQRKINEYYYILEKYHKNNANI